jgi:hypothetical protein
MPSDTQTGSNAPKANNATRQLKRMISKDLVDG